MPASIAANRTIARIISRSQNDERSCQRNFSRVEFAPIFLTSYRPPSMRNDIATAKKDVQGHYCPASFACAPMTRGRDESLHSPH